MDWIAQAKQASMVDVASEIGISLGKSQSLTPCPACGSITRGSTDKRGPIGMNASREGWKCHSCEASGDVVDLVSFHIVGRRLKDCQTASQHKVVTWFKSAGLVKDSEMPTETKTKATKNRPPRGQVHQLWLNTQPVSEAEMVVEFLSSRHFDVDLVEGIGFVRATRKGADMPAWWPKVWAKTYRLITPAYDADGNFVSLHARAVCEPGKGYGKTRWPKGHESGGLFMANRLGVKLLKGKLGSGQDEEIRGVLICEGLTDLLRASVCAAHEGLPMAVLAGTSGSFQHLGSIRMPKDATIYTAMDPDSQGAKYMAQINKALFPTKVRPLPIQEP